MEYSEMSKSEKEIFLKFMFEHPSYDAMDLVANTLLSLSTINKIREEHGFKPLRVDESKIKEFITGHPSINGNVLKWLLGITERPEIIQHARRARKKHEIDDMNEKIESYVRSHPGASVPNISKGTGISKAAIRYRLKKLDLPRLSYPRIDYGPINEYIIAHPNTTYANISRKFGISSLSARRAVSDLESQINRVVKYRRNQERKSDADILSYLRVNPSATMRQVAKWANVSSNVVVRVQNERLHFRVFRFKVLVEMVGAEKHLDQKIINKAIEIIDDTIEERMEILINRYISPSSRRNLALGFLYLAMRQDPVVACAALPVKWFGAKTSFLRVLKDIQDTIGVETTPPKFVCIIPELWLDKLELNSMQKLQIRDIARTVHDKLPKSFTRYVNRSSLRAGILYYVIHYMLELPISMTTMCNATGITQTTIRSKVNKIDIFLST